MASQRSTPKDAQVMTTILKDMGIIEYEPRVVNQMLEFTYRYVTNILEDARVFSSHAKKKNIDLDDVKLAIQMQMDKAFTTPPPRDILVEIARQRNNIPLPLIKPHCGPRLPPDRYCLSACNYKLKAVKKHRQSLGTPYSLPTPKINIGSTGSKVAPAVNIGNKTGATLSLVTKGVTAPTVTIVTRPATTPASTPTMTSNLPTPIIRLTQGTASTTGNTAASSVITSAPSDMTSLANLATVPTIPTSISSDGAEQGKSLLAGKRKREDDTEDYDAP